MSDNICNIIPYKNDYNSLHTINFVFETKEQVYNGLNSRALYVVYYVCSGTGILHLTGKTINLSSGDIFFTFPGLPFCLESKENFTYMYISFIGSRANLIMEKIGINHSAFHFSKCEEIYEFWKKGLSVKKEISDLIIESILLSTFYYIGEKILIYEEIDNKNNMLAYYIKKYIDDNYFDNNLSLELISKELLYTPKYISSIFKKTFNIKISQYITTLRLQHACTMMQQGFTSISDISNKCGYRDSQYFSKIFKKEFKKTPTEYIKNPN